jgi:hypothetical protein
MSGECSTYGVRIRPEERRPIGRPRCGLENNMKMGLQNVGWGTLNGLIWLRIGSGGKQI